MSLAVSLSSIENQVFGRGACQSSSFFWPVVLDYDTETWYSGFEFQNTTLATHLSDRPPQSILIDVGQEQDPKMQMVGAAQAIYEKLGAMDIFEPEVNLWVHAYPGMPHSQLSFFARAWSALSILSKGRAYPRRQLATLPGQ
jgi:hypothetical protein